MRVTKAGLLRGVIIGACILPMALAGVGAARQALGAGAAAPPFAPLVALHPLAPSSSLALARQGSRTLAFVADEDESSIDAFDVASHALLARTIAPGHPSALVVTSSGLVIVTMRERNVVTVFEASDRSGKLRESRTLATAADPVALALSPDESTLLVVCAWSHRLEAWSTRSWTRIRAVDLSREPRAAIVDDLGAHAYVAHATGSQLTVVDLRDGTARDVSIEGKATGRDLLPQDPFGFLDDIRPRLRGELPPRRSVQGFALAKLHVDSEQRVLVPGAMVDTGGAPLFDPRETLASTGYGRAMRGGFGGPPSEIDHVASFDDGALGKQRVAFDLEKDTAECILPRAAFGDDGTGSLFVACLGTNRVIEYDAARPNAVDGVRARWDVPDGPTGLAADGEGHLVVWSAFDRVLTILDRGLLEAFARTSPTEARPPSAFEVGRKLFHASGDRRIAADGRACASCHPDGRDDGLVWTTPDGPRQTPMLADKLATTAPFGWDGASATVREHVAITMRRLDGRGLAPLDTLALLTCGTRRDSRARAHRPSSDPRRERVLDRGKVLLFACGRLRGDDGGRRPVRGERLQERLGQLIARLAAREARELAQELRDLFPTEEDAARIPARRGCRSRGALRGTCGPSPVARRRGARAPPASRSADREWLSGSRRPSRCCSVAPRARAYSGRALLGDVQGARDREVAAGAVTRRAVISRARRAGSCRAPFASRSRRPSCRGRHPFRRRRSARA